METTEGGTKRKVEETEETPVEDAPATKKARTETRPEMWKKFEMVNPSFEEYYKNQPFMDPSEHETFFKYLRTELPSAFRISRSSIFRHDISKHVQNLCSGMTGITYNPTPDADCVPVPVNPPKALPWYPPLVDTDGSTNPGAWSFALPKRFLKKVEAAQEFNKYLVEQTELGTITRQEEVSMIPPMFLDVQPHHNVLDMCAAPGSKTSQLVEFLHAQRDMSNKDSLIPTGIVIANDADRKRCTTLSHQINRFDSPCVAITNHQGQFFPALVTEKEGEILFDRILCDVPCSGDGTMRKNPDVWDKWNANQGPGLHGVQISITHRAFALLKPGGRIVFSTCSMNPIEDEAVVSALLRKFKGELSLVDVSHINPELKRRPGVSSWKVMDRDGNWYEKHEDLPESLNRKLPPSCFPPTPEEAAEFNLHRSFRILPHDQDTGGFFVAVFEKSAVAPEAKEQTEEGEPASKSQLKKQARRNEKSMKNINTGKDALVPLSEKARPFWDTTKNFFGISEDFSFDNLVCHSQKDKPNKISFVSPKLADILKNNLRLKVVGAGLVILVPVTPKMEQIDYKPASLSSSNYLGPFMTKRVVEITSTDDLLNLLVAQDPFFSTFSEPFKTSMEAIGDFGPCIFSFKVREHRMYSPGWKGHVSCKFLMSKKEKDLIETGVRASLPSEEEQK
eukprot:TRINITY_DN3379_c0_g1_i1.p1 TRINITY_DN3379_c0_g1~~TRINITY_DN3379_c0_g1_i1.p1  ORF type:complete len:678 (+),score=195.99 TRINITY_DN3379_c0_g1_i1:14-2047(+)